MGDEKKTKKQDAKTENKKEKAEAEPKSKKRSTAVVYLTTGGDPIFLECSGALEPLLEELTRNKPRLKFPAPKVGLFQVTGLFVDDVLDSGRVTHLRPNEAVALCAGRHPVQNQS